MGGVKTAGWRVIIWEREREREKDDEQGKKEESERESMKDRNKKKGSVSAEWEQRQRRSDSVKSYCTKYISGANISDHVHAVETTGSSRWQEELLREIQTRGRRSFTLWAEVQRGDGKLLSDVRKYVCACMCIRAALHVTGSQHEGKCRLSATL